MLIDNVTGKDVEQSVDEILSISPEIKKKLQFLVPGKKVSSATPFAKNHGGGFYETF